MAAKSDRSRISRVSGTGGGKPRRSRRLALLKWGATGLIWVSVLFAGAVIWYAWDLPDPQRLDRVTRRPSVTLLDSRGDTLATFGDLYGAPVGLDRMPPYLPKAVIAVEDRRFMDHPGIDPWGLARAAIVNLREGRIRQGGSTITQQLAKNLFLTPRRNLRRKVQEMLLALWLEYRFSKRQILAIYLNRVYLGAGTYGVDAAARKYFGKSPDKLSLYESAMLAGMLKAPSRYNPLANPKAAARRAALALNAMVQAGYLSRAEAAVARSKRRTAPPLASGAGRRYFADWVLEQVPGFVGYSESDLIVVTTLDARLQAFAEVSVTATLDGKGAALGAGQAALVALAPGGAVRAMVGGRDYRGSQFNRATQGLRQPGSAFKPFVFLAALEAGLGPDDRFYDGPLKIGKWSPRNYANRYYGEVTLRDSLARSLNSVAVRVSERVGRKKVIEVAKRLGITSKLAPNPSIALGASEVSLLELTGAYAAFANRGLGVWPYGIVEIRNGAGEVLYRRAGSGPGRVMAPEHVAAMNDVLRSVVVWGTGKAARFGRPAAGKTGTSQEFRDAWFIGYTPDLVTGVWLGNDGGAPMKGVTGGSLPARLWKSFMARALTGTPPTPLPGVAR